jgi:glutaconyl-CoA/methylmalonyl-CoA decarboxylase subunit gamma
LTSADTLRITVGGAAPLEVQLDAVAAAECPPQGRREAVRTLPTTPADRAAGVRRFEVVVDGWRFEVTAEPARRAALRERATRAAQEHRPKAGITLRAQIPGRVVRLWAAEGDEVEMGQRLLAVEAMKMENEIRAPHAGRVTGLRVEVGHLVERSDELLTIA